MQYDQMTKEQLIEVIEERDRTVRQLQLRINDELSVRRPGNYSPTYSLNEILPNGKYRSPFSQ